MKKIFALLFFINGGMQAHAIYFSEIMYDPQGSDTSREWVEIYNDTNAAVDLTSWKFLESGTNHGITSYSGGNSLPAGTYAVIADNPVKFMEDNSTYQGILYDSSFSLSNSGETLVLKNGSGLVMDTLTYDPNLGGNNDGSTLSKTDLAWVRGDSTPANANQVSLLSVGSPDSIAATTTDNQATIAQMAPPSADIILYLPFEKIVVAGAEAEFTTNGLTRAGKVIDNLTCNWSFGDGGQGVGTSTSYRYVYSGQYIAQVEGTNGYVKGLGRMKVRVVPPDIAITKIDTGKYGAYVDINNPNNYDLDLSQWKLSLDGSGFPFPKNTLLAGKTTTRFSGLAMGFASTTISTSTVARILFPNLEEVARFAKAEVTPDKGLVLGVATTSLASNTNTTTPTPIIFRKTINKINPKVEVASTSLKVTQVNSAFNHKDTRMVSWFKALLGL